MNALIFVRDLKFALALVIGVLFCDQLIAKDNILPSQTTPISHQRADSTFLDLSDSMIVWSDEFDGEGIPDPTKWDRPEYLRRGNDSGPDGYWERDDSYLDGNGNLIIRQRQIENRNDDDDAFDYATGAIRTKGKFEQLYGIFQIRCQLPSQPGWWVAFWMMQGNVSSEANKGIDGSEVDIMEGFGWTDNLNLAIHYDGYGSAHKSTGKKIKMEGIREGFHTYSLLWTPDEYVFYIDSVEQWRTTGGGVCDQPGYLKITGECSTVDWAINEYWANDPATATYPDSFVVDYVRVYKIDYPVDNTGVENNTLNEDWKVFPNPSADTFRINWPEYIGLNEVKEIVLFNSTGQKVKSFEGFNRETKYDVSDLPIGMYVLSIQHQQKQVQLEFLKTQN